MLRSTRFAAMLLGLASFAGAFPLKLNTTWTWIVKQSGTETKRTAKLIASAAKPEGTVWSLMAYDSGSKARDTALILERPSGRTSWLHKSPLMLWELESWRKDKDSSVHVDSFWTYGWGQPISNPEGYAAFTGCSESTCEFITIVGVGASMRTSYHAPEGLWSDSLGLLRAREYSRGETEWELVAKDGRKVVVPGDTLLVPPKGTVLVWEFRTESESSYTPWSQINPGFPEKTTSHAASRKEVKWEVLDVLPDSSGWARLIGRQTTSATCRVQESTSSTKGGTSSSWCDSGEAKDFQLRLQRTQGRESVASVTLESMHDFWWRGWVDLGRDTARSGFSESSGNGATESCSHSVSKLAIAGQIDSTLDFRSCSRRDNTGASLGGSSDKSTIRLLSRNSIVVRPTWAILAGTRSPTRIGRNGAMSLMELVGELPSIVLGWSTAAGRTGTIAASEFVRSPAALRGKTLFLQARLPDGRIWQGTHVMP